MAVRKWRTEKTVNTTTAGNQVHSDVAALNDGGYVIAWEDANAALVRAQVYDADGSARTAEFVVSGANGSEPDVAPDAAGGFWVGYTQTILGSAGIRATGYNTVGSGAINVTVAATADTEDQPAITRRPGAGFWAVFHIADSVDGDIQVARYDGVSATVTGFANNTDAGDQFNGDIEVLSNGNIVAVWNDADANIRMRMLSSAGIPSGADAVISSFQIDTLSLPKITALSGGRFVVVHGTFNNAYDSGRGVAGVLLRADGAITNQFFLHSLTDGAQAYPEVIGLRDGGFLTVWTTGIDSGSSAQIRGQVFDPLGFRSGGEFIVSTLPSGGNLEPLNLSLALLADGRVVVTWEGFYDPGEGSDSDGSAIHSQIIDPRDGVVTGTTATEALYGHDTVGDEINALGGDDTLWGLGGNDNLFGGTGNDDAFGGKGDDVLYGSSGADVLLGEAGDDELYGEEGNDDLRGGAGADNLDGGAGIDTANYGSSATGVTVALDGSLAATGDAAGDSFAAVEYLKGSNAAGSGDTLRGDGGANALYGNAGNDNLSGLAGHDKLIGGAGTDTMAGGTGNDQFIYNALSELPDFLTDFSSNAAGNNDVFLFKGSVFGGLPSGTITAAQFQSSTAATAANGTVRFFYEIDTRILRFDADGSGAGSTPVVIATLQVGATMTFQDISVF